MLQLASIKDSAMQVAEAITVALEIETEIVDENLLIIAGTGRYRSKIGQFEEDGNLNSELIYAAILRTGKKYICNDCLNDPHYGALEGELAEISCPILLSGKVIGIIGLVAFNEHQQQRISEGSENLLQFLSHMAELIASKLIAEEHNKQLRGKLDSFVTSMKTQTTFDDIAGESKSLAEAKRRALQVASGNSIVLITGESGTGKELFARAIHCASARADYPFVSINCGAIPEMLLESELFGYEGGAFTGALKNGKLGKFEIANGGTIFLDEIGDLPLHMQVKLLHVIQNRCIERVGGVTSIDLDVRIITATNKDLEVMVAAGEFREDLFFRLNVIPLAIPPLRERTGDLELLLNQSLQKFAGRLQKPVQRFSDEAIATLLEYHWPGNVRELENVAEYAVNMADGPEIQRRNLPERIINRKQNRGDRYDLKAQTDVLQKKIISECLMETGDSLEGKRTAAELLGISESTLYRRLRELDIRSR